MYNVGRTRVYTGARLTTPRAGRGQPTPRWRSQVRPGSVWIIIIICWSEINTLSSHFPPTFTGCNPESKTYYLF